MNDLKRNLARTAEDTDGKDTEQAKKSANVKDIHDLRNEINSIDAQIATLLTRRMDCINEIIEYKRIHGTPIIQPEQEEKQKEILRELYVGQEYAEEKKKIFKSITKMSKLVQAKALVPYNIALIGFMGAGKSTVSAYLQKMLPLDLVEVDAMIVDQEGMSINDIFARYGEEYFRECESRTVVELQERELTIISCGGGLVMREENVKNLKKHSRIVLLTASPEEIYERVKNSTDRPILNGNMNVKYIAQLMEKRREKYEAAADVIINTDHKSVNEICEELIRRIH